MVLAGFVIELRRRFRAYFMKLPAHRPHVGIPTSAEKFGPQGLHPGDSIGPSNVADCLPTAGNISNVVLPQTATSRPESPVNHSDLPNMPEVQTGAVVPILTIFPCIAGACNLDFWYLWHGR
jgi:hypothetical protein